MQQTILSLALILCLNLSVFGQSPVDVNNIDIVRDSYGVPHIFTQTDAEATYGIAWAQCEDNFHLMQDNFAIAKNMSGRFLGKKGAVLDFLYQVFDVEAFVESRYDKDISPEMEKLLISYTSAMNKYAETHPEEVKHKDLFPVTPKEVLGNHNLHMLLLHSTAMELGKFLTKGFDYALIDKSEHGSNAMAYGPNITEDGKAYLVGNPHQPVNQMGNWWEASVHSQEGYEMYGATFSVGGLFFSMGANRNLGWSHTTNYHNSADVYLLEMHPKKKNMYKYDDEWIPLEVKHAKLKVKLGGVLFSVRKKYYVSKFGPTFKKNSGYYSFKPNAFHNLKVPEQWYRMGRAKNFEEFTAALDLQGLANQTITYSDKDGNIYHLSNFIHPFRNENEDWKEVCIGNTCVLDGTTSANNWGYDTVHPIADLPQVLNPKCGYVYNCNNTVLKMTAPEDNQKLEDFPQSFGILTSNTVRAKTFEKLISQVDKISFEQAREIRESLWIDKNNLSFRNCMNCNDVPAILARHPELAAVKAVFDKWDGSFEIDNKQASFMVVAYVHFEEYVKSMFGNEEKDIPEDVMVDGLLKAEKFLMKHYKTLEVPLGDVQKAVRYGVEMPMYGGPNTLANCHSTFYGKDKIEITGGDSFVFYAKYGKDGLEELETVNAFGNSLKEGHPHSTDQTELYVNRKTKTAQLDLDKLRGLGNAYHPQ